MKANTQININKAHGAYLSDAVKLDNSSAHKWVVASESLFADGIRADHIATEKKGGVQQVYEFITESIINGYAKADQALLRTDVKSLDDAQKAKRKELQQRLGTYRNRLQKYLTELAVEAGEVEVEEKAEKTPVEKIRIALETAVKIIQGDENPQGYDPVDLTKRINSMLGSLPA
jgi:acyl-CoA reductase-like NAD-dependent aldehyde dehydrogenase